MKIFPKRHWIFLLVILAILSVVVIGSFNSFLGAALTAVLTVIIDICFVAIYKLFYSLKNKDNSSRGNSFKDVIKDMPGSFFLFLAMNFQLGFLVLFVGGMASDSGETSLVYNIFTMFLRIQLLPNIIFFSVLGFVVHRKNKYPIGHPNRNSRLINVLKRHQVFIIILVLLNIFYLSTFADLVFIPFATNDLIEYLKDMVKHNLIPNVIIFILYLPIFFIIEKSTKKNKPQIL